MSKARCKVAPGQAGSGALFLRCISHAAPARAGASEALLQFGPRSPAHLPPRLLDAIVISSSASSASSSSPRTRCRRRQELGQLVHLLLRHGPPVPQPPLTPRAGSAPGGRSIEQCDRRAGQRTQRKPLGGNVSTRSTYTTSRPRSRMMHPCCASPVGGRHGILDGRRPRRSAV